MFERLATFPPQFIAADGRRLTPLAYLFLLMLCLAFFTPGLATMPPTDRDESLFAQASKQMVESGDYIDIKVQDAPRYKKPIGIYWLQSGFARAFAAGHLNQIWAYRLPSLIGATVAVLMTAAIGALLFNPMTGLLAAMMLAGCVLLNVEARLATTDGALLGCIVTAMYGLARAYRGSGFRVRGSELPLLSSPSPKPRTPNPLLFWTALAFGVLLKGPIILLPVAGVLIWSRVSDGQVSWFRGLRPAVGALYALCLVAPWFIAISLHSHGAFMEQSAGHDMLAKIWQGQNRGRMMPGLHLLALPVLFFPFSLLVVFAAPDVWRNRADPAVKFCLGWIVPTWIVFELSLTKLPHYVLPTYPALALLAAKYLSDGFPALAAARRLPMALTVGLWLAIGTGFAFLFALLPFFSDHVWFWPQIIAGLAVMAAQATALLALPQKKIASVNLLAMAGLIFMNATFGDTLPRLRHVWVSREIVDSAAAAQNCPGAIVAAGYHEPSLVFMAGTDTILAGDGAAAAQAFKQDGCRIAVVDARNRQGFLDGFAGGAAQPVEAGTVEGLNAGHGGAAVLTVYRMP